MSLIIKRKASVSVPPVDAGAHMAVLVGIVDLGKQYQLQGKKYKPEVGLVFEIPSLTVEIDGEPKPRWIYSKYTQSLNEKAKILPIIKGLLGTEPDDDFNIGTLLNTPCILTLNHYTGTDGVIRNGIVTVGAIPNGFPVPQAVSEPFSYDVDAHNQDEFDRLPEWMRERIKKSTQWAKNPPEEKIELPATTPPPITTADAPPLTTPPPQQMPTTEQLMAMYNQQQQGEACPI